MCKLVQYGFYAYTMNSSTSKTTQSTNLTLAPNFSKDFGDNSRYGSNRAMGIHQKKQNDEKQSLNIEKVSQDSLRNESLFESNSKSQNIFP